MKYAESHPTDKKVINNKVPETKIANMGKASSDAKSSGGKGTPDKTVIAPMNELS